MSSYDSLLSAAPPMRLYNALSSLAPDSGFAKKTRKVKSMAAGLDGSPARKRRATVKTKRKVTPSAVSRGNRSGRRTLINIGGEGNGLGL